MVIKMAAEAPARDFPRKRRDLRHRSKQSVLYNIDLLTQILLRLPASSAMKFKSVCKSWNSLLSSRSFCLLWQQHRPPGLLFRVPVCRFENPLQRLDSHRCISLFGSNVGANQFRMSCEYVKEVLQSSNGFLLLKGVDDYWIYNPATTECITLPRPLKLRNRSRRRSYRTRCESSVSILELKEGQFRPGPCRDEIKHVNFAFNKSCNVTVVVLTKDKYKYIYQIYLAELGGNWRHSGQVFKYGDSLDDGVYWNNSIVWLGRDATVCFDVGREELRVGAAPPGTLKRSFNFEESGGHLHFIQMKDWSTLVVHEMMPDLSAWFVKYSIASSQIDFSHGNRNGFDDSILDDEILDDDSILDDEILDDDSILDVCTLIELDKNSAVLVLGGRWDLIAYKIQDQITTKICSLKDLRRPTIYGPSYKGYRLAYPHIESILQFPSSIHCNKKVFF